MRGATARHTTKIQAINAEKYAKGKAECFYRTQKEFEEVSSFKADGID
ncbi:MAG: hypothetical protein L6V93_10200 [Clostridiales bacterium]|nr:MAG: hypothetical protein L6V93_10200 [Clostridiales bacterium]